MNGKLPRSPPAILLVEDNPADVRLFEVALQEARARARVTVASDGSQALRMLRREGEHADEVLPDLVLLDLNVPVVGGRRVLEQIKASPELRWIPVVVMTSSAAPGDVEHCYDLGANGYVNKPIDLAGYLEVVRALVDFWLTVAVLPPHDRS